MIAMDITEFTAEMRKRRSVGTVIPRVALRKKDVLSESCLGLCVE